MNSNRIRDVRNFLERHGLVATVKHAVSKRRPSRNSDDISTDGKFNQFLEEANSSFQRGRYSESVLRIKAAALRQKECRSGSGLEALGIKICGSNVLNPFGHMAIALEVRAKRRMLGLYSHNPILMLTGNEGNTELGGYWSEHFPTVSVSAEARQNLENALWPIVENIGWVEGDAQPLSLYEAVAETEGIWAEEGLRPLLNVSVEHEIKGRSLLTKHGVTSDQWFVALHVRSGNGGLGYGRNANHDTYDRAVKLIHESGGHVVLLGKMNKAIKPQPNVISMEAERKEFPWLDLFLLGSARFVIGTQSGPTSVAAAFGTPVLMTNSVGWGFLPYHSSMIVLPKKILESKSESKILTLPEMAQRNLLTIDSYLSESADHRYRWLDNSASEIERAVEEMMMDDPFNRPSSEQEKKFDDLHTSLVGYRGPRLSTAHLEQE
jgi:putative glycosyltransferase (TIGR04372 family)